MLSYSKTSCSWRWCITYVIMFLLFFIKKSSTIDPSRLTAWALTPALPLQISSDLIEGTSF